jgi:hypothetical protein
MRVTQDMAWRLPYEWWDPGLVEQAGSTNLEQIVALLTIFSLSCAYLDMTDNGGCFDI